MKIKLDLGGHLLANNAPLSLGKKDMANRKIKGSAK